MLTVEECSEKNSQVSILERMELAHCRKVSSMLSPVRALPSRNIRSDGE